MDQVNEDMDKGMLLWLYLWLKWRMACINYGENGQQCPIKEKREKHEGNYVWWTHLKWHKMEWK